MLEKYLQPDFYTDSDHAGVIEFAHKHTQAAQTLPEKAIALYYAVRDSFRYNPYNVVLRPEALKASVLLGKESGYCIEKSNLYAACLRVVGVPSRLGFANVRNHLATSKLEEHLQTDVLAFHGYTQLYINGKWVKATPVFDKNLCERLGVAPLDFDGTEDSIFQRSDKGGQPFMEYVCEHGVFDILPFDAMVAEFHKYYPHLFKKGEDRLVFSF